MPVRWRYHDADGSEIGGPDVGFDDQADAEEWMGREWQGLLDAGVHSVTLLDGDEELYGPMSLHPA